MLRLTGITKTYSGRQVLADVSLHVPAGAFVLVTGPNGAGKSTLLHIMAGLTRPDSGTVERTAPAGKTGFLGHETLIYPHLTAFENLAFWSALHTAPNDETLLMEALDRVGLASFADDAAGGFSRGMAQRLSFARLFLLSPALVLLDEPLTGLDADSAERVRSELYRLRETGAALVWVSHDPERDAKTADAILHLAGNGTCEYAKAALAARVAAQAELGSAQQDCQNGAQAELGSAQQDCEKGTLC